MRLRLTRVRAALLLSAAAATVLATALLLLLLGPARARGRGPFLKTCHRSAAFHADLHRLADRTHRALDALGLLHFLCYGALWGQIRMSRSLPWESDVEFCLLNEELGRADEVFLLRAFRQRGLELSYQSGDGFYAVWDRRATPKQDRDPEEPQPLVQLVVFEEDPLTHVLRRVGWKRRVLPPDCEATPSLHCFPPRLAARPLPVREFGGFVLPVPREGIELQKYLFPDSWWKEVVPLNC